jgi:hypothetical protein
MMHLSGKERLVNSNIYSPGKRFGPMEENASINKKYSWASAIRLSLFQVRKGWPIVYNLMTKKHSIFALN